MDRSDFSSFSVALTTLRRRRGLTRQQLATQVGVCRTTIETWERGEILPASRDIVMDLACCLHLDEQQTDWLLEASLTTLTPLFLVPLQRNPFFTGREEVLQALSTHLSGKQERARTRSLVLYGPDGIGKTQIALEYAYRHVLEYHAIFWIEAETAETLLASLLRIAEVLQLHEHLQVNQQRVVVAVRHWLSNHSGWLLIWDNVEDLALLDRFLPFSWSGAILITTRRHIIAPFIQGIDLSLMQQEESRMLLLRRADILTPDASGEQVRQFALHLPEHAAAAAELVTMMAGLPLALNQAGAYLQATQCELPAYLTLFQTRWKARPQQRWTGWPDYRASVSTAITLAITHIAHRHPAALDLLLVCACFQPEAIPEELFRQGGEHLGATLERVCQDPLDWEQVVTLACAYALLSRQRDEQTLSLHRQVQTVLIEMMTEAERTQWIRRAMSALELLFPDVQPATGFAIWKHCERLQPHALFCLQQAEACEASLTFASLAYKVAQYLRTRGRYIEAEPLYLQALHIREQIYGPEHVQVACSLNDLAILYWCLGRYEHAEPLYQRALHIWEQSQEPDDLQMGGLLNNLGFLYRDQGRYTEAEPHYLRSLQIWEQSLGPDHPDLAHPLSNLAVLYRDLCRYSEAESLALRARQIWEQSLGPAHPLVASALNMLAMLYRDLGRYSEVEPLALQALFIREQSLGSDHPDVAYPLITLAELYRVLGRYSEAEPLALQALSIREQGLGSDHPLVASALNTLAGLYRDLGRDAEAETFGQRALLVWEQRLLSRHPETGQTLHDLAALRQKQGHPHEAIPLAEHALSIRLESLGDMHPKTLATRTLLAQLHQEQVLSETDPHLVRIDVRGASEQIAYTRGEGA